MALITPIVDRDYTTRSTTSTTDVAVGLETSALANGSDYLIIVRGNVGGSDASALPVGGCSFLDPNTDAPGKGNGIASARLEGRGLGNPWDSGSWFGAAILSGNGVKVLQAYLRTSASDTAFIGGQIACAIPLNSYTAGVDYFSDQVLDPSATDAQTTDDTPVAIGGTITFSLPGPTQDWIIFASVKCETQTGATNADARSFVLFVDGVQVGPSWHEEFEDTKDTGEFGVCYVLPSLAPGNHDFELRVFNRAANTVVRGLRHKLVLLRAGMFRQVKQVQDSTGLATPFTNTTYSDSIAILDTSIEVEVADTWVLAIATVCGRHTSNQTTLMEIRNKTTGVSDSIDSGNFENGWSSGGDLIPTTLVYLRQHSASAETIAVRARIDAVAGGGGLLGRNENNSTGVLSNLVLIELATPGAAAPGGGNSGLVATIQNKRILVNSVVAR